jgi:hypothetical protein
VRAAAALPGSATAATAKDPKQKRNRRLDKRVAKPTGAELVPPTIRSWGALRWACSAERSVASYAYGAAMIVV